LQHEPTKMKDTQKVTTVRDAQDGTRMGSGILWATVLLLAVAATVGAQERLGITTGHTYMGKPMGKGGEYCRSERVSLFGAKADLLGTGLGAWVPHRRANSSEFGLDVAWPDLPPAKMGTDHAVRYETLAGSGYGSRAGAGSYQPIGFGYDLTSPQAVPAEKLHLPSRDGSEDASHDWSHAASGVLTSLGITHHSCTTPAVATQTQSPYRILCDP